MRYIRITGISLLMLIYCMIGKGQSLVNVVKPSPSVQAMQKFGDIPVTPYTGVPAISIPIYTIQFRDISLPIGLNYHASGIKVAEEASEVGLGWVLNTGGSVSRNIIGDDDFNGSSYLRANLPDLDSGLGPQAKIQAGCVLSLINQKYPALPTLYSDDLSSVLGSGSPVDWQPDQYYYSLPGKSGKFTVKHDGVVLLQNQEKLDISYASDGSEWQVKDESGNVYDFTVYETYQSTAGSPVQHKSAWYLTQMTSPSGNHITFNYTALPANFSVPLGSVYESKDAFQLPSTDAAGNIVSTASLGYHYGNSPAVTYYRKILSSIDFTNGLVKFSYSGNRTDMTGDVKLDSVCIYEKDMAGNVSQTPLKTFQLFYSYFFGEEFCYIQGTPLQDNQMNPTTTRLRLDSVQATGYFGGDIKKENPYKFNYVGWNPINQPSKQCLARDHWGFYNGKSNNISLIPSVTPVNTSDYIQGVVGAPGPERNTDTSYARVFSLSSIEYPTGGSTEFQMESNDYDLGLSEVNDHTILSHVESSTPEESSTGYDGFNHRMYSDSVIDMSNEYYRPDGYGSGTGTPVSITVTVRMQNSGGTLYRLNNYDLLYFSFIDSNGNTRLTKDLGTLSICNQNTTLACLAKNGSVYSYTYTNLYLPPDRYTVRMFMSHIFDTTVADFLVDVHWLGNTTGGVIPETGYNYTYGFAGGLRVKRIIDHDGISPANDHVKRYVYHYTNPVSNAEYSYGRRMSRPQYFYFEWVGNSFSETDEGLTITYTNYTSHLFRSADSDNPLNGSASGSPVGYDQVTVLDGENGENGKSVYSYYNQPDLIYDFTYNDLLPHRPPANSATSFPLNGSLLHQVDYANVNGPFYKKKEITNEYTDLPVKQNILYGVESRAPLGDYTFAPAPSNCSNILLFYPAISSQWNTLLVHDEKLYNGLTDTVNYLENRIQYYYDNPAHFLPTRRVSTNSKGETVTTFTRYPLDYSTSASGDAFNAGINKLNAAHVVDIPVETYEQHSPADGAASYVSRGGLSSYASNLPKPNLLYRLEIPAPYSSYSPAAISNGTSVLDANYKPYIYIDQYDNNGNVLQQGKANDMKHTYIYDYNNSLPIADVSNASVNEVSYTSFEADGTGGWTIENPAKQSGGITGGNYCLAAGAVSKSGLSSGNTYIVSYWTTNSTPFNIPGTVTGYPVKGKAVSINIGTWTYFEHKVTGQGTIQFNVASPIDELRLYPASAQMSTYTFQPLTGITSQCDVGNRVSYYDYDGLGRLQDVKDQDGNVIKTIDYHYKGQQ